MNVLPNFIDNEFIFSKSRDNIPVKNPAFDSVIAYASVTLEEEVDRAVESGVKAFKKFRKTTPSDRVAT